MVFAGIIVPSTFHCSTCLCATSALFLPAVRSWWRNMEKMIRRRNRMSKGRMSITHMLWCYCQVFVCVCKWESVFCFRSGGERGTRGKKERRREKRKGGYCECCEVKFDNIKAVRAEKNRKSLTIFKLMQQQKQCLTCLNFWPPALGERAASGFLKEWGI